MGDTKTLTEIVRDIADGVPPPADLLHSSISPLDPHSSWREEVIVTYCVGNGTFSKGDQFSPPLVYINLQMDMYDLHGRWLGFQLGVHESNSTPADLLAVWQQSAPWTDPPVPHPDVKEWTKGIWTFDDGSEIHAVGPAQSHLIPFKDGSFLFMVTTGQTITNGTGRYAGCHGIKEATGTAWVPPGLIQSGKFPEPGGTFVARTLEVFRIIKKKDLGPETLHPKAAQSP
jgi:hypothetical protein